MAKFSVSEWLIAAGLVAVAIVPSQVATGAVGAAEGEARKLAEAALGPQHVPGGTADFEMRFVQEDGPESGHVRVLLTPETRPLTLLEARLAAQRGFLEALGEPGLGNELRRIVVVVRLMPASHPDAAGAEQKFLFLRKAGATWSVVGGE